MTFSLHFSKPSSALLFLSRTLCNSHLDPFVLLALLRLTNEVREEVVDGIEEGFLMLLVSADAVDGQSSSERPCN